MASAKEIASKFFPDDTDITSVTATEGRYGRDNWVIFGPLARPVRKYPTEVQEAYFFHALKVDFVTRSKDKLLPRPNLEGTARMLTRINTTPLKTDQISLSKLQELATASLAMANSRPTKPIQVNIVEGVEAIHQACDNVIKHNSGFPLPIEGIYMAGRKFAHETGLIEASRLQDPAYMGGFTAEVLHDVLVQGGWIEAGHLGEPHAPEDFDEWGILSYAEPHSSDVRFYMIYILGHALFMEYVKNALVEKGITSGNPLEPLITMLRPGVLPIGWDGQEFLVAQTLPDKVV